MIWSLGHAQPFEAATFLREAAARVEPELAAMVTTIVEAGAFGAKALIGHEHDGWAPLSTATTEGFRHENGRWIPGKIELGYGGAESPLLRTGDLRDSVEFLAVGLEGAVGSNSRIALYQEMGTPSARNPTPPRPFISRGLHEAVVALLPELAVEVATSLFTP